MSETGPPTAVEYRLLGPLEVRRDGRSVALDGLRLRALLARLLLDAGRSVSADRLIEDVWDGRGSRKGVQVAVGRLRSALSCPVSGGFLTTRGNGYGLTLREADRYDVACFEADLARARDLLPADPERALALVGRAVGAWRGPALEELSDLGWALTETQRLEQLRSDALELRREAQLALGAGAELVAELEGVVAADPGRERAWEQLMLARYRAGRQLDALRAFHQARAFLVEEHGVEPGQPLRALHQAILLQDPGLAPRPARLDRVAGRRLPLPLSSFVGRDAQCAELQSLLQAERLVTLTGVGGAGKTRLAIAVAEKTTAVDQVFFVDLTTASDDDEVEGAWLRSLGLSAPAGVSGVSVLEEFLAPESVLVVLDNCEHVRARAAATAAALLERCAGLRVLATSRVRLDVPGEVVWLVPPMSLDAARPADCDAVRLLVERARAARPDFTLDERGEELAGDICARLDGIPLAIELAAARLRILSLSDVASALGDQLSLLGGGPQVAAARQQTLRASIAWSEALLTDAERALLHRLAVFSGGSTLSETRAVCCDDDVRAEDLYDLLTALVDNSLVVVDTRTGTTRYRLTEPVRQYGVQALEREGRLGGWRERHLATFALLLEELDRDDRLIDPAGLALYDAAHPNFVSALHEALARRSLTAVRMGSALADYWIARGGITQGARLLEQALAVTPPEPSDTRCIGLSYLSVLRLHEGRPAQALALGQEALEMSASLSDPEARALARMRVGLLRGIAVPRDGLPLIEEAISLMADRPGRVLSFARHCHVDLVAQTDDWSRIEPSLREARVLARRLGHQTVTGWCSVRLAHRAEATADLAALRRHAADVVAGQDDPFVRAHGAAALARAAVLEGAPEQARQDLLEALDDLQPGQGLAQGLLEGALAGVEFCLGDLAAAEALLPEGTLGLAWISSSVELVRLKTALRRGQSAHAGTLAGRMGQAGERLGNARARALADLGRAAAALVDGEAATARRTAGRALPVLAGGGFVLDVLDGLELVAATVEAAGDPQLATRLLAAVAAERSRRGIRVAPDAAWSPPGSLTRLLVARLGPAGFDEAWQAGGAWGLADAVRHSGAAPSPAV